MTAKTAPSEKAPAALFVLLFVVFINLVGFGVVIPLLPFYAKSFGAQAWQVALIFSAYSLGNFFAEPFWGRLSDKIGRKPVLIVTISFNALAYIALAFAPSIWIACAIRLFGGLMTGNISTIQGYIADITPGPQRASRLGLLGAAFGLGFVVGPSISGLLAHPELGELGFRIPLFVAAGLCAIAALGVVLFVRESRAKADPAKPQPSRFAAVADAKASPIIKRVLMVTLVSTTAFAGMEATFGLWSQHRYGWGPREVGLSFAAIGITAALCQGLLTGRLARRFGEAPMLATGLGLVCLSMSLQPLTPGPGYTVALMAMTAFGQSLALPNISALISQATAPDRQGAMLGLNLAAGAAARIIGPLYAGAMFSFVGPNAPYFAGALIVAPAVWFAIDAGRAVKRVAALQA
jgi:DHA1 family tetracycline resistance protein-like MFS transporter